MSIELARPFRGSAAIAAGLLTWGELRGPRFQRLFPDIYAPADLAPDLAVRSAGGRTRRLDLAYPAVRLAIEYDGEDHRTQDRAHRDLLREAALVTLGWTILRFDAYTVYCCPAQIARTVGYELRRRGYFAT